MAKAKGPLHLVSAKLTREEKIIHGKGIRDKVSRADHAEWKPKSSRPDPVGILIESSKGRDENLLPIRYGRMLSSPFAFYRGAASIMASDLSTTPRTDIIVQACGDCHLVNFGGFATPERSLAFDINDFDETLPAPWEWDLKRLAVSFVIAGQNNGLSDSDVRDAAIACVRSYREWINEFSKMSILDRWYYIIDGEMVIDHVDDKEWQKQMRARVKAEEKKSSPFTAFPKMIEQKDGELRIKDEPPLIFHPDNTEHNKSFQKLLHAAFDKYRGTLSDDKKLLLDHYELKDMAMKVVGVGSVGTRCGILLMMSATNEPLFLQVKEARVSVMEKFVPKSLYKNRGQRVVVGQRIMQSASDMFLGWTEGAQGRHFYIRQLRDTKIKPLVETFTAYRMEKYASLCGWTLARAHAKGGNPAVIAGYLGKNEKFDNAIAKFSLSYAGQNEKDFEALKDAVRKGKLRAVTVD
ncbi:MAG TPA: DUF2252 domain-containing protein [Candidatus Kapabacteria bacterium]